MTEKLLPCPFCGGEAEVERHGSARHSNIIACTYCGCRLESGDVFNTAQSWNTRTPSPQTGEPSERDAVIEECAKVADSRTVGNDDEYDYHDIGAVVCAKYIADTIRQLKGKDRP